jgi:hypothetical protein
MNPLGGGRCSHPLHRQPFQHLQCEQLSILHHIVSAAWFLECEQLSILCLIVSAVWFLQCEQLSILHHIVSVLWFHGYADVQC